MESTKSSIFDSFKSEKITRSRSKLTLMESDPKVLNTKTPEKPSDPPLRTRNRRPIMSIKELRQAAQALQKPDKDLPVISDPDPALRPDPVSSTSIQKSKTSVKLPEKYEMLDNFFNGLDSAIRLLQLKGSATTFGNIIPKVECLTDRRFTYKHLAQLKFIFPEAIVMRKVLVRDERTSCMKPDLHIALNVSSVVENGKEKSVDGSRMLRKMFRSRLVEFFNTHLEGDEVPAASLPKPFDEPRQHVRSDSQYLVTQTAVPTPNLASSVSETCPSSAMSPLKVSTYLTSTPVFETPSKDVKLAKSRYCLSPAASSTQGTPAHLVSTPAKLMSATPLIQPPKRRYMTPGEESFQSPEKLARRPPRSRSLKFDANVDEDVTNLSSNIGDDILDVLPQDLLESIREKERKVLMENDPAISQAKWRQKMIAKLPKFFDMVYFLFQSIKRSVITKDELVHKILSNNLDIIDKSEVEEHLALLKEVVPEWIYEKNASSGDLLFCINKIQNPQSIRSRITEAT